MPLKIGIAGCAGRMGRLLVAETLATAGCRLVAGTVRPGSAAYGADVAEPAGLAPVGVAIDDDPATMFAAADAVIDCTTPQTTVTHAQLAARHGTILVVGTTGLEASHHRALDAAAHEVAVVQAPNTSVGVTLLTLLVEEAARVLGPDYDLEVVEMHHHHKVDAPSGTARALGRSGSRGHGVELEQVERLARQGEVGPRPRGEIGFGSLRGGDVSGEHTAILAGPGERIELSHRALARALYARGAVRAALWARGRPAGRYSMRHVLDLV